MPSLRSVSKVVLVGTYPPRQCGLATFGQDLLRSMRLLLPSVDFVVCAVNQSGLDTHAYPPEVVFEIDQGSSDSYAAAAHYINLDASNSMVIIQHEYGIYGDKAGEGIKKFMKAIRCPAVTTLHTVVSDPTPAMRRVTKSIIQSSDALVTLTKPSHTLFSASYASATDKAVTIPHGIHPLIFQSSAAIKPRFNLAGRQVLLTFGLLNRNKGIEYAIKSLPAVASRFPEVIYLVVGATHPNVVREEGEAYRLELMKLVKKLGMQKQVRFIDNYLPVSEVLAHLQAADIYLAPFLDPQQAVSGTLTYALGAGRAVVATEFAQAKELVLPNVGRLVPARDSKALAQAVNDILSKPSRMQSMHRRAYASTRHMLWSNVADNYLSLLSDLAKGGGRGLARWPEFSLKHLQTLTDEFGLLQFASGDQPLPASGYTLDDNSRALQLVNQAARQYPKMLGLCAELSRKYLGVIKTCLAQNPPVNYLSNESRSATDQNWSENLEDSGARAYHALQTAIYGPLTTSKSAKTILKRYPPKGPSQKSLRPVAFYLLGACQILERGGGDKSTIKTINKLSGRLIDSYNSVHTKKWQWFEPKLTYANGQLSRSLLETARRTGSAEAAKIGLESLNFLCRICFMGEVYAPIGQNGWYQEKSRRAIFDQQPEDTLATIQALQSAYGLTQDKHYAELAKKAFSWFLGNNLLGLRMYDDKSGGCHDGLTPGGVNPNEGAESSISYLQAWLAVEQLP